MEPRTRLKKELIEKWLKLRPSEQELTLLLVRLISPGCEAGTDDLPNYERSIREMNEELARRYGKSESPNTQPATS